MLLKLISKFEKEWTVKGLISTITKMKDMLMLQSTSTQIHLLLKTCFLPFDIFLPTTASFKNP